MVYTPGGGSGPMALPLSVKLGGYSPRSGLIRGSWPRTPTRFHQNRACQPGPGPTSGLIPFGADSGLMAPNPHSGNTHSFPLPASLRLSARLISRLRGSGREGPTYKSAGGRRAALGPWPRTFDLSSEVHHPILPKKDRAHKGDIGEVVISAQGQK